MMHSALCAAWQAIEKLIAQYPVNFALPSVNCVPSSSLRRVTAVSGDTYLQFAYIVHLGIHGVAGNGWAFETVAVFKLHLQIDGVFFCMPDSD